MKQTFKLSNGDLVEFEYRTIKSFEGIIGKRVVGDLESYEYDSGLSISYVGLECIVLHNSTKTLERVRSRILPLFVEV